MGKSAKGINIYFIIIVILLLVTVWVSTIKEKGDQYTKGEFVSQLEEGQVTAVEIQPNSQVPTGTLTITLAGGTIRTHSCSHRQTNDHNGQHMHDLTSYRYCRNTVNTIELSNNEQICHPI